MFGDDSTIHSLFRLMLQPSPAVGVDEVSALQRRFFGLTGRGSDSALHPLLQQEGRATELSAVEEEYGKSIVNLEQTIAVYAGVGVRSHNPIPISTPVRYLGEMFEFVTGKNVHYVPSMRRAKSQSNTLQKQRRIRLPSKWTKSIVFSPFSLFLPKFSPFWVRLRILQSISLRPVWVCSAPICTA